ncbi:MAG: hypothetical protein ABJY31_07555 [Paracoccaceae bacterium]
MKTIPYCIAVLSGVVRTGQLLASPKTVGRGGMGLSFAVYPEIPVKAWSTRVWVYPYVFKFR